MVHSKKIFIFPIFKVFSMNEQINAAVTNHSSQPCFSLGKLYKNISEDKSAASLLPCRKGIEHETLSIDEKKNKLFSWLAL